MTKAGQNSAKRLRAFCASLALLIGSLAAPVALSFQSSSFCAMTCCVEEGRCCCTPQQAYVKGETPDSRPTITLAEASVPCPEGCAGAQSSTQLRLREIDRNADHHLSLDRLLVAASHLVAPLPASAEWEHSSPRGPPLLHS